MWRIAMAVRHTGGVTVPEDVQIVLDNLVAPRTDDLVADLCSAGREVMRRRKANTADGAVVFAALRDAGLSWRQIEDRTGVAVRTARRWAEPPP